jgi:hypothetical protein
MAVGVPATGIGGIFYILLSIVMLLCKTVKKILSFLKTEKTSDGNCKLLRFPTLAFIMCIILLIYMNVTGFRFIIPGTQEAKVSMSNLWIASVFAVSFFTFFILLFHIRAKKIEIKSR